VSGTVSGPGAALRAALLAAVLSGCADAGPAEPPPACPRVGFLYGLHAVDTLAVEGRSLPVRAELAGLRGACIYSGSGLELDYTFDLLVRPNAPVASGTLPVSYFVAVLDDQGQVIDRQRFVAQVPVGRPGERTGVREHLRQTLEAVDGRSGPAYRVVIGFDLPPDDALARWQSRDL
jgi:hypothetical protein